MAQMTAGKNNYHTHISSQHNWFDLKLKEVWRYRDLIWLFTKRSFTLSYKQTVLGPLWILITPLLASFINTFIFGTVAGMSTDGIPQILFYLTGNAIWSFFASSLSGNANVFRDNAGIFGKVYFPRMTAPLSNILSGAIRFCIQMILAIVMLFYYVYSGIVHPNWAAWILLPVVLLHLGVMGMSIGIIISSFTTKYRDLTVFIGYGISLLMYATPIVYPLSQLEDGIIKNIILLNPITAPVEFFRYALLGKGTIIPACYLVSILFTLVIAVIGIMVFNHTERTFMDTV